MLASGLKKVLDVGAHRVGTDEQSPRDLGAIEARDQAPQDLLLTDGQVIHEGGRPTGTASLEERVDHRPHCRRVKIGASLQHHVDSRHQLVDLASFHHPGSGPALQRVDDVSRRLAGRQHDDLRRVGELSQISDQSAAGLTVDVVVEDHDVGLLLSRENPCLVQPEGRPDLPDTALTLEAHGEDLGEHAMVVDDQQ
ncbi:MAG TPA: hypothetical protein VFQ11_09415 [Nocardioidaceae bacterium]|nr:hypothetical protein [Nocardioidaceae bacterium]